MIAKSEIYGIEAFRRSIPYIQNLNKAAWISYDNLLSPQTAQYEMESVARQNFRVKKPAYELVLSWHPRDIVTDDKMEEVVRDAMLRLGLAQHQWLAARHRDRPHPHVHVTACRIHPETYGAAVMSHDWHILDFYARELESIHGWALSHRYEGRGALIQIGNLAFFERDLVPRGLNPAAMRGLGNDGRASFQEWLLDEPRAILLDAISAVPAPSWLRVHGLLAKVGVRYEVTTDGGLLVDAFEERFRAAASQIGRFASLPKLEQILGEFRAFRVRPQRHAAYSMTIARGEPYIRKNRYALLSSQLLALTNDPNRTIAAHAVIDAEDSHDAAHLRSALLNEFGFDQEYMRSDDTARTLLHVDNGQNDVVSAINSRARADALEAADSHDQKGPTNLRDQQNEAAATFKARRTAQMSTSKIMKRKPSPPSMEL